MTPREKQLMALSKAKALRRQENRVFRKKKRFSKSPKKPKVATIPLEQMGSLRYNLELPTKYSSLSGERLSAVKGAYICLQRERCWLCGDNLYELPKYIVDNPKVLALCFNELAEHTPHHLHHDHDTGLTLGVTHAECNIICGVTYELADRLQNRSVIDHGSADNGVWQATASGRTETLARNQTVGLLHIAQQPVEKPEVI